MANALDTGGNYLPSLAAGIKAAHDAVGANSRAMAEHALEAGRLLIEAKDNLKHGEFGPWLREHVSISERTARRYMTLARAGVKTAMVADFGVVGAVEALSANPPPTPEIGHAIIGHDDNGGLIYLWPGDSVGKYTHAIFINTNDGAVYGSWRPVRLDIIFDAYRRDPPEGFRFAKATYQILDGDAAIKAIREGDNYRQLLKPGYMTGGDA